MERGSEGRIPPFRIKKSRLILHMHKKSADNTTFIALKKSEYFAH